VDETFKDEHSHTMAIQHLNSCPALAFHLEKLSWMYIAEYKYMAGYFCHHPHKNQRHNLGL
jgi:hypothetical protein